MALINYYARYPALSCARRGYSDTLLGHGDSARVVVRRFSGDTLLSIRWPHRRVAVTDDDRIDAARWIIAHRILNSSTSRERYERESRAAVREGIERTAFEWTSFPEFVPAVTAAYAAGQCLFLAGHAPRDWVDGTALTWVAMNVESGTLEAVFRIPPPAVAKRLELDRQGAAVREIDGRFVYVSYRDGDGVYYVERFQLPPMNCGLDLPARPLLSAM